MTETLSINLSIAGPWDKGDGLTEVNMVFALMIYNYQATIGSHPRCNVATGSPSQRRSPLSGEGGGGSDLDTYPMGGDHQVRPEVVHCGVP